MFLSLGFKKKKLSFPRNFNRIGKVTIDKFIIENKRFTHFYQVDLKTCPKRDTIRKQNKKNN